MSRPMRRSKSSNVSLVPKLRVNKAEKTAIRERVVIWRLRREPRLFQLFSVDCLHYAVVTEN